MAIDNPFEKIFQFWTDLRRAHFSHVFTRAFSTVCAGAFDFLTGIPPFFLFSFSRDGPRGTRDGVGVMAYPNGEVYDGRWRSNMRHGHGCMVRMRSVYAGDWHFDEVGAEIPVWEPFEDDSYIDHAVNRDALLHMARALGCDKGKARVVHDLMSAQSLKILAKGAMNEMRNEWAKLRKEEDRLLIIAMGPRHTHPASLREDLHRVRKTGAGLVKKARELIAERAWEVLPERAKATIQLKTQVKMTVTDLVSP